MVAVMGLLDRFHPPAVEQWRPPTPGACRCESHVEELLDDLVPLRVGGSVSVAQLVRSGALITVPAPDQLFVDNPHTTERRGPFHWRVLPYGAFEPFCDPAAPAGLDDVLFVQSGVENVLWLEEGQVLAVGAPRMCMRGLQAALVKALSNPRVRAQDG